MDPSSEVRRVADEILGRIVAGAYPAGLRLPAEVDLANTFGCGRSTVREALRHLAGLGVVKSRRGSGAMVLDFRREGTPALLPWYILAGKFDRPAPALARELLNVRRMLAQEAVRLAARYAEPADLAEARALLARGKQLADDPVAFAWNELEFFRALVCASGIWPAVWLANVFWPPLRDLHAKLAPTVGVFVPDHEAQMLALLALIERRDEQGAERHLAAFLDRMDGLLLAELARTLAESPPPARPSRAKSHGETGLRSRPRPASSTSGRPSSKGERS